ncbi:MAG: acyl-CoA thioesterase [Lentisphaeria bacterium]|nr:acyl-CoA thioesterase [Lentisphaeria bacterium]
MFSETIKPRFCETDLLGHINNTVVPVWLEVGRTPVFELFTGPLSQAGPATFPLLLVSLAMDFRRILRFGVDAVVETSVTHVGRSSFALRQVIRQQGEVCVEAKATVVHADVANARSAPIPEPQRRRLEAWHAEAQAAPGSGTHEP